MHDVARFVRSMRAGSCSVKELAQIIGVSIQTAYNRVNGLTEFRANEIAILARYFNLSNMRSISFSFLMSVRPTEITE